MPASGRAFLFPLLVLAAAAPARADFQDVTSAWGFFGAQPTWGGQILDADGDGDLDVFNSHHFYSGYLFTNDGSGGLSVWGLPQLLTSTADRHGYLWADFDGDAVLDVVCSHGSDGGCATCSDDGHELWRGQGAGTFALVPDAGGMYDQPGRGRAFSAFDLDLDGDLELYHAKAPTPLSLNSLYRNDGAMTFVDVAADWGLAEEIGTVGGLFADVDDDGDADLLVGGDEFDRPTTLFRNEGAQFLDVTSASFNVTPPIVAGMDFGDFDDDGDLDLALAPGTEAVYDFWKVTGNAFTFFANHRYGDGGLDIFELESAGGDPSGAFRYRGSVWNPYIFLGPNGVHPTGSSYPLTDAYVGAPAFTPGVDLGLYCWRDAPGGRWNIHVSAPPGSFGNFSGSVTTLAGVVAPDDSLLERLVLPPAAPRVYRNDGGVFHDLTAALSIPAYDNPRHVTWVDFDLDSDLDLHVVNRGTVESGNAADALFRNDDGMALVPIPGAAGAVGFTQFMSDGAVWGDLDRDGDLDAMVQEGSGPITFTSGCPGLIYRNDGVNGHWLTVKLAPPPGAATPVGARVDAWADGHRVHRRLTANGWRGFQPPLELSIGLGTSSAVDSLVVTWPNGVVEPFGPFPADRIVVLVPGGGPTGVGATPALLEAFVSGFMPQPSRGPQALRVRASSPVPVRVSIYDVSGRLVREVGVFRASGPAPVEIAWDGRDSGGLVVPAGIYFARGTGGVEFLRKSVRLR